eukprot:COSAG02_NODE_607_length_19608_cov_33.568968_10_plen_54_part_00
MLHQKQLAGEHFSQAPTRAATPTMVSAMTEAVVAHSIAAAALIPQIVVKGLAS